MKWKRLSEYLAEYDDYCDSQEEAGLTPSPLLIWLEHEIDRTIEERKNEKK